MGKLKQEFSQEDIYDILTSSKLHITNMFIYLLFEKYNDKNKDDPDFNWHNLVGYKELVNFILYQIH